MRKKILSLIALMITSIWFAAPGAFAAEKGKIVHDAEYYILEAQNGEKWAAEDKELDKKLAEFMKKNGGKPPNIFYILIDDIGFGDLGDEALNSIRGYKTPSINKVAREGMRLSRMYTEPSCTPTRVAFMTGRQPYRNGMGNTSVDISGFGLAGKEVTLAEILSDVGYNTVHIGPRSCQTLVITRYTSANGTWAISRKHGPISRVLTTQPSPSTSRAS
jgi:arylsulfatase